MDKKIIIAVLLVLVLLIVAVLKLSKVTPLKEVPSHGEAGEDEYKALEEEMNKAVENISVEDIESVLSE